MVKSVVNFPHDYVFELFICLNELGFQYDNEWI